MELYSKYLECGLKVTTDSRTISGGELFFALKGENFDGNAYALQALEKGARYAVVDDPSLPDDARLIKVPDSFRALQELAIYHREHVLGEGRRLKVIGLTGTNGKTTTKELIREVLAAKYRVVATEGNLNNDIGVPLSLLKITPDTQIAVIEMGANHPDDIAKLVQVSRPDYGLITNVGTAHLLGFGSFEGVKAAKGELYKYLGAHAGSLIFLNEDDPDLREMARRQPCHTFGYGLQYQRAQLLPTTADCPFLGLKLGADSIRTSLVGAYNATNVLAAIAVGEYFGVPRADAIAAIEAYVPSMGRSQLTRTQRNTLIVDAYNANPSSMKAALDNFAAVQAPRKLALLGDMRELGDASLQEHVAIVQKLRDLGLEAMLVGDEFRRALESAGVSMPWFASSAELAQHLAAAPVCGAVVLVKGSRGITMEKTLPEL